MPSPGSGGEPSGGPVGDRLHFHHLGVVVPTFEHADRFMRFFGLRELWRGDAPKYEAECIFVRFGGIRIEFIVPYGERLRRFNKGRGGIHHVAVTSDLPVTEEVRRLTAEQGAVFLEEATVPGASLDVNFLQPLCTGGVLVEFVEPQEAIRDL